MVVPGFFHSAALRANSFLELRGTAPKLVLLLVLCAVIASMLRESWSESYSAVRDVGENNTLVSALEAPADGTTPAPPPPTPVPNPSSQPDEKFAEPQTGLKVLTERWPSLSAETRKQILDLATEKK